MTDLKKHGNVIIKFNELNSKLRPHGLMIHAWGRIAIVKISNPYQCYLANNIDSIEEVEQWVDGFLYAKSLTEESNV